MARLEGKVCVITGAKGGIGASAAELFAREGAIVVGVDLAEDSPGDLALACDVTDDDAVRELYARVRGEYDHVDVLFNNAGISPNDDASVLDTSLEAWQRVQDVNLKSVFLCCKYGIPHLLENERGGSVINTASFVAVMGAATSQISYTASKGALEAFTRQLAAEVVRVREPDVAVAVGDLLEHVGVRAEDVRVVGHPAPQHAFGGRAAVLGEPVGHERDVVLAGARAQAEPVLPARVAKTLVGGDLVVVAGDDLVALARGEIVQARPGRRRIGAGDKVQVISFDERVRKGVVI